MTRATVFTSLLTLALACSPGPSSEQISKSYTVDECEEEREKLEDVELRLSEVRAALNQASAAVQDLHFQAFALRLGSRIDIAIIEVESAISDAESAIDTAESAF